LNARPTEMVISPQMDANCVRCCVPQAAVFQCCVPQAFTPGNEHPTTPCATEGVYALSFSRVVWKVPGVNAWGTHLQSLVGERGKGRKRPLVKLSSAFFRPGVNARPTEVGAYSQYCFEFLNARPTEVGANNPCYSEFVNARPAESGRVFHSETDFVSTL